MCRRAGLLYGTGRMIVLYFVAAECGTGGCDHGFV